MDPIPFQTTRPHPWHGLAVGPQPPSIVHAFIEITPYDLVKYEVDKRSGYMRVDRPQRSSSTPPTLYGFIPRTLCADRVAALSPYAQSADGDPLDISVLSERPIDRGDIVIDARVIGGLQMLDDSEADDKIIAVLVNDPAWGEARDIAEVPPLLVERLLHYFNTYKLRIGEASTTVVRDVYGFERAARVVEAARADYAAVYSRAAE
jgi:inorganic pyrophosphatase